MCFHPQRSLSRARHALADAQVRRLPSSSGALAIRWQRDYSAMVCCRRSTKRIYSSFVASIKPKNAIPSIPSVTRGRRHLWSGHQFHAKLNCASRLNGYDPDYARSQYVTIPFVTITPTASVVVTSQVSPYLTGKAGRAAHVVMLRISGNTPTPRADWPKRHLTVEYR